MEYYKKNISVLWVLPEKEPSVQFHDKECEYVHRVLEWEKYLHALNYGKLYYWQGDNTLKSYHFESFKLFKEESEWYNEYGQLECAGGYHYYAKNLKLCSTNDKKLYIEKDFNKKYHKHYFNDNIDIPECLIYSDKYGNWWKK